MKKKRKRRSMVSARCPCGGAKKWSREIRRRHRHCRQVWRDTAELARQVNK